MVESTTARNMAVEVMEVGAEVRAGVTAVVRKVVAGMETTAEVTVGAVVAAAGAPIIRPSMAAVAEGAMPTTNRARHTGTVCIARVSCAHFASFNFVIGNCAKSCHLLKTSLTPGVHIWLS